MDNLWHFHLIKGTHLLKYATLKNVFESHLQTSVLRIQHFHAHLQLRKDTKSTENTAFCTASAKVNN